MTTTTHLTNAHDWCFFNLGRANAWKSLSQMKGLTGYTIEETQRLMEDLVKAGFVERGEHPINVGAVILDEKIIMFRAREFMRHAYINDMDARRLEREKQNE